jgi:Transposase
VLSLPRLGVPIKMLDTRPPRFARCPRCGDCATLNEIRSRFYWEPNLLQPSVVEVRGGCYLCPACPPGIQWFIVLPQDYQTEGQYTALARSLIVDLVRKYKMSAEAAAKLGRQKLNLLKLDATTVLGWLQQAGIQVDRKARLQQSLAAFSGQMSLDEVYDAGWYQLKATDPLNGIELSWKLERGSPTANEVRQFLRELKEAGFEPQLISTDGSDLYPEVIAEIWPNAQQQRCVFHFIQQINRDLGEAFRILYRRVRKPVKRGRGPHAPMHRRKDEMRRKKCRTIREARWLFLKREDRLKRAERSALTDALVECPRLLVLRRFVLQLHELFGPTIDSHELSEKRRKAILEDGEFLSTPSLAKPMRSLRNDQLFSRLTRYLDFENADKTSNHVERENREFRKRQKGHYRMRCEQSLRALLELLTTRRPIPTLPIRLKQKAKASNQERQVA